MEKKPEDYHRHVSGVALKRSDLKTVGDMWLGPPTADNRLHIETESHVFSDVDELISFKEPISEIRFGRRRENGFRYEELAIRGDRVSILINNVDDADIGRGSRVHDFMLRRRRRLRLDMQSSVILFFVAVGLFVPLRSARGHLPARVFLVWAAVDMLIALAAVFGLVSNRIATKAIKFRPEQDETRPIDWRSALWQLFLLLVGAVVGAWLKK